MKDMDLNAIKEQLDTVERLQFKMEQRIKDTAAYRESNAQLTSIIKVAFICFVVIVAIFCAAIMYTVKESQTGIQELLSGGTLESTTETQDLSVTNGGIILNDVTGSNATQNNTPTE